MSAILVAAFFDQPTLVGVRLEKEGAADPVVRFATTPRPVGSASSNGCMGPALVALGAGAVILMGALGVGTCSHRDTPVDTSAPALGTSTSAFVPPPIKVSAASDTDCDQSQSWQAALASLDAKLEPVQAAWKPWFVRTLLRVPQTDPGPWIKPRAAADDAKTRDSALALAEAFASVNAGAETAIVLDLPGPQSVAAAGALCDRFEPVFTFDNIPDGAGVSPAQDTLGAVLYWLPRLERGKAERAKNPSATWAPVFVLDATRLNAYKNEVDRFDNRYRAKLPSADALKAAGVKNILYVRPTAGQVDDSDDLNDLLASWRESGLSVKALGLSALEKAGQPTPAQTPANTAAPAATPPTTTVYRDHYYYGNSWSPLFWHHYGWYGSPGWDSRPYATTPPPPDSQWQPQRRTSTASAFAGSSSPPPAGGVRRPAYRSPASSSFSSSSPSRSSPPASSGSWGRSSGGSFMS